MQLVAAFRAEFLVRLALRMIAARTAGLDFLWEKIRLWEFPAMSAASFIGIHIDMPYLFFTNKSLA